MVFTLFLSSDHERHCKESKSVRSLSRRQSSGAAADVGSSGLEKCQKSLNDYLDSKRNAFPRFFFISDDELLSILGSHDPQCVQEHMIKVTEYDGIRANFIA